MVAAGSRSVTSITSLPLGTLAAERADVAILDADPNKGAHRWATETYGGGNLTAYAEAETERLAELVPQLADRHDVLIADTAGFGNRSTVICIGAADGVQATIRQYESRRRTPTGPARTLLRMIAREPDAVTRALAAK